MSPNRRDRPSFGRSRLFGNFRNGRKIISPRFPGRTKSGTFLRSCPKRLIPTRAERNDGPKKQVFLHARLIPERISDKRSAERPETAAPRQSPQRQSTRNGAKAAKDGVHPRFSEQSEGAGTHLYALARSGPAHTRQSVRRQEAKSGIPNRKTGTTSTFQ